MCCFRARNKGFIALSVCLIQILTDPQSAVKKSHITDIIVNVQITVET